MDVAEKRSRAQARVEAARRRGDTAEVAKWEAYLATLPAADSAPAAAAPPPKLPAKKPAPPAPAPARSPAPAPVPVVAPKPALPPAAKPMPARVELVREAPQVIDVSGAKAAKADVVKTAPETQSVLQQQLIAKGMRPDVAEQVAKDQVARVLRDAAGARGDAGPADATLLPFAKESKIVPYLDGYVYTDDGLGIRKAGALELAGEALKRQQVMSSQQRAEYRAVADKDATGGMPISGVLSAPDPRTGRVVETPFGAAVRGATSWLPSALSTAIMDYAPIFYDVDEQGNPVDKEQAAYKVREFLDEFAPEASKFQRETGRLSPKAALLPAPFTGTTRKTVKGPAYADPTGGRAAPTTGSFVSDVALHVAKGRSMGDELISLPAYAEGNEGASFATGIVLEVLTPAGPGTAVRSGRALLKAASGAADAAGATKTARALGAVAAPVEAARTSLVRSAGKDIVGDSEELAKAADRNQVLNVVADKVVEDVAAPFEAVFRAARQDGADIPRDIAVREGAAARTMRFTPDEVAAQGVLDAETRAALDAADAAVDEADAAQAEVSRLRSLQAQQASLTKAAADAAADFAKNKQELDAARARLASAVQARNNISGGKVVSQSALAQAQGVVDAAKAEVTTLSAARESIVARGKAAKQAAKAFDAANAAEIKKLPAAEEDLTKKTSASTKALSTVSSLRTADVGAVATQEATNKVGRQFAYWRHAMTQGDAARLIQRAEADQAKMTAGGLRGEALTDALTKRNKQLVDDLLKLLDDAFPFGDTPLRSGLLDIQKAKTPAGHSELLGLFNKAVADTKAVPQAANTKIGRAVLAAGDSLIQHTNRPSGFASPFEVASFAGRVREMVKADLRNVIPEDLVFVTSKVMVPRNKVDLFVAESKKVADLMFKPEYADSIRPRLLAAVEKTKGGWYNYVKQTGRAADKPLTPVEFDLFLSDFITLSRTNNAVGGSNPDDIGSLLAQISVPAVFGGAQVADAARASGRTGGVSDAARGARDLLLAITPASVVKAVGELKGDIPQWLVNKQKGMRTLRSAALDAGVRRISEETGQLTDRLRAEMKNEMRAVSGAANVGAAALNNIVAKRMARAAEDAAAALEKDVDRLKQQGWTTAQAYFIASYQRTGRYDAALGMERVKYWDLPENAAEAQEFVRRMQQRSIDGASTKAWEHILTFFFGEDNFNRAIAPRLREFIAGGGGDTSVLPVTVENVAAVFAGVREADASLKAAGIGSGVIFGSSRDNIVGTLVGWVLETDRARIVRDITNKMLSDNPLLGIDLLPSFGAGRNVAAARLSTNPVRGVQGAAAQALLEFRGTAPTGTSMLDVIAATRPGDALPPEAARALSESRFMQEIANIAERDVMNLNADEALGIAQKLVEGVLARRTLRPARNKTALMGIDVPAMEKQATIQALLKVRALISSGSTNVIDQEVFAILSQRSRDAARNIKQSTKVGDAESVARQQKALDKARKIEDEAISALFADIKTKSIDTILGQLETEVISSLRANGLVTATTVDAGDTQEMLALIGRVTPDDPRALLYGSDYADAVKALSAASADGRLLENLEDLRRGSRKAHEVALGVLSEASGFAQRTYSAGMLGGILLPNTRYLGVNLLTAPLVMMTTLGRGFPSLMDSSLVKAKAQVALSARAPSLVAPGAADDVLFTDARGVPWTRGALLAAADRNNLGMSRGDIEFESGIVQQIAADMRVLSDGAPESVVDAAWRLFRPDTPSVWQRIANETDMAFRQSVFAGAIKAGRTEEQAAELARASVLDYGATPAPVRAGVARVVMFASFRLAMLTELLNGLARDPSTFARVLRAQMRQQQEADTWMTGEDQNKTRLPVWPWKSKVFDSTSPSAVIGPQNPMSSTLLDLVNAATYVSQLGQPDNNAGQRAVDELVNQALTPGMEMVITSVTTPTTEGPAGKAPTEYIVAARFADALLNQGNPDLYHWFIDYVDLEPVPDDKMRAGQETVNGYQWRFGSSEGKRRFQLLQAGLAQVGAKRMIEDYSKALITVAPPTGVDPKRRGEPTLPGFLLGAETSIQAPGAEDLEAQSYEMAARRLQQMQIGTQR